MATNFSSIGFQVDSEESFAHLCEWLEEIPLLEYPVDEGQYLCWDQDEEFGPEIWVQIVDEEMVSVQPFFRGKSEMKINIEGFVEALQDNPLDGFLKAQAETSFVFSLVGLKRHEDLNFPSAQKIMLTGFANSFEYFENEKEAQKSLDSFENFVSSDDGDVPSPEAAITGRVLETRKIENEDTGDEFYWVLIKTKGGTVDIVIDPEYVETPIAVGSIVSGSFYLCADLITEEME